jgi:hypothetical protein
MSQRNPAERVPVAASPETDEHAGGVRMAPPPFTLFADGADAGGGSGGGADGGSSGSVESIARETSSDAATRFEGPYARFPEALQNILAAADGTRTAGSIGYPGTYEGSVPANSYAVLWDLFKALHWTAADRQSPQDWARASLTHMESLRPALVADHIDPNPLIASVSAAMAPIINLDRGSAAGLGMEATLIAAIDNHRIVGPLPSSAERYEAHARKMHRVIVAAANILSAELTAAVPQQILNAASPYNFLSYNHVDDINGVHYNALTALYRARWEVSSLGVRRQKIDYGIGHIQDLWGASACRRMLEHITTLDTAGIDDQIAHIQAAVATYVTERAEAVRAEPVSPPIAHDGAPAPVRAPRSSHRGGAARTAAPIVYEPGTPVTVWEGTFNAASTVAEVLAALGDTPHYTLGGENIGSKLPTEHIYPYVRNGRRYEIVCSADPVKFGIRYTGGTGLTNSMIDELLADTTHNYFTPEQREIVQSVRPHVRSEGSISSINTWDKQVLTVAGRGELSNRFTTMIDAGEGLKSDFQMVGDLSTVRAMVEHLKQPSPTGVVGNRFDIVQIENLINQLDQPDVHRIMTLAKLNDAILTFYGISLRNPGDVSQSTEPGARGGARRYRHTVPAAAEERLRTERRDSHLHPVIMGIAIHNALGASAEFGNPMEYAIRANHLFPQRPGYGDTMPDFVQLSKQVAYLMKIRMQNKWNDAWSPVDRRGHRKAPSAIHAPNVTRRYFAIFNQKVSDFETYFSDSGIARPGASYFHMPSATEILPFWTGPSNYESGTARPAEGTLYLTVGGERYYNMGPLLDSEATALRVTRDMPESAEVDDDASDDSAMESESE